MSATHSNESAGAGAARTHSARLCAYAAPKLDARSLRCWLIRRLMLDDSLDHASAEQIVDELMERASRASAPAVRQPDGVGGGVRASRLRLRLHRFTGERPRLPVLMRARR